METLAHAHDFLIQIRSAYLQRRQSLHDTFRCARPLCIVPHATLGHELSIPTTSWEFFLQHQASDPLMDDLEETATRVQELVETLKGFQNERVEFEAERQDKIDQFTDRLETPLKLPANTGNDSHNTAALRVDLERDQRARVRALAGAPLKDAFCEVLDIDFKTAKVRAHIENDIQTTTNQWHANHALEYESLLVGKWKGINVSEVFGFASVETAQAYRDACAQKSLPIREKLHELAEVTAFAYQHNNSLWEQRAVQIIKFVQDYGPALGLYDNLMQHTHSQAPTQRTHVGLDEGLARFLLCMKPLPSLLSAATLVNCA